MLIGAVVAAVAHLIFVEIKLPGVVEEAAVVLLWKDSVCQEADRVEWRNDTNARALPSRQEFRRCRRPCHKRLPDHLCQSLPVQSWEGWDSYPEIRTECLWILLESCKRLSDFCFFYLLAVVGCISAAHEVLIGPTVQIWVLSTDEAVPSVTGATLTLVHGVAEVADVNALCMLVAVMGFLLARILGFTHLNEEETVEFLFCPFLNYLSVLGLRSNLAENMQHMKSCLMQHTPQYHRLLLCCCGPGNPQLPVITGGRHSMSSWSREWQQRTGHWSKLWNRTSLISMWQILSPQIN